MRKLRTQGIMLMHTRIRAPTPSTPPETTDTPKQVTPNQVATQMGNAVGLFGLSTHMGYLLLLRTGVHARSRALITAR